MGKCKWPYGPSCPGFYPLNLLTDWLIDWFIDCNFLVNFCASLSDEGTSASFRRQFVASPYSATPLNRQGCVRPVTGASRPLNATAKGKTLDGRPPSTSWRPSRAWPAWRQPWPAALCSAATASCVSVSKGCATAGRSDTEKCRTSRRPALTPRTRDGQFSERNVLDSTGRSIRYDTVDADLICALNLTIANVRSPPDNNDDNNMNKYKTYTLSYYYTTIYKAP